MGYLDLYKNPWKRQEPTLGTTALALWTMRGWDVAWNLLCPDTDSSQRYGFTFCHWASRRSIWSCLAGSRLSLGSWEGRVGWQTEPGQDPCLHQSEPRDTTSWLSPRLTHTCKTPLDEDPLKKVHFGQLSLLCHISGASFKKKPLETSGVTSCHCWQITVAVSARSF